MLLVAFSPEVVLLPTQYSLYAIICAVLGKTQRMSAQMKHVSWYMRRIEPNLLQAAHACKRLTVANDPCTELLQHFVQNFPVLERTVPQLQLWWKRCASSQVCITICAQPLSPSRVKPQRL